MRSHADRLVEITLLAAELHGNRELRLGRQLLGVVPLVAAKDVRCHRLTEGRETLDVAAVLDGLPPKASK